MSLLLLAKNGFGRAGAAPPLEPVIPFFSDNLAGGHVNPANGFAWTEVNGTVSDEAAVNGGTHSIRLTYSPTDMGVPGGGPEIRFSMGREVLDLWVEYWIKIPPNYYHRNNYDPGPPVSGMSDNNKFWNFWSSPPGAANGGYAAGGWQVSCQPIPESATVTGGTISGSQAESGRSLVTSYCRRTTTVGAYGDLFSPSPTRPLLFGAGAPGAIDAWSRIRIHVRRCSAPGVADGVWQMWCNDFSVAAFTVNAGAGADHPEWFDYGLSRGYFMGSANSGFAETTTFYLADFKFYDSDPGWMT